MAAVLHPSCAPRHGILLNPSPSVSPYQHCSALPLLVPSNISLSSSASSASNPNTSDYEYFPSSASNSKETSPDGPRRNGAVTPHTQHLQKPRSGSSPAMRRIRFAPLPDPRREQLGDPAYPSVFLDDTDEPATDATALGREDGKLRVHDPMQGRRSPSSLLFIGSTLFSSSGSGSNGNSGAGGTTTPLLPSESTATLTSTITATAAHSAPPTPSISYLNLTGSTTNVDHEWTILPASPHPSVSELSNEAPRRSGSTGSKWSRKLFKPLLGPLANRASSLCDDGEGRGAKGTSSRSSSRSREREPEWVREFGAPLHRWTSEGDPWGAARGTPKRAKDKDKDKKGVALGRTQSLTEEERGRSRSGSAASASRSPSQVGNGRRQQKMLNGRVYGAKRSQNPFANVRSEEPEFVEWGYGGMGSVQTGGVGASVWAKVQSGGGVKVGAHEGPHARGRADGSPEGENVAAPARSTGRSEDGEDGSGMSWVKRRREEREKREREEREKREREEQAAAPAAGETAPEETEAPAQAVPAQDVPAPSPAALAIAAAIFTPSPVSSPVDTPPAHAEGEHVYTAVAVPAPAPHHHHSHSYSHSISHHHTHSAHGPRMSIERIPSVQVPKPERNGSLDTARGVPGVLSASAVDEAKESQVDEASSRRESMSSESTESGEGVSASPSAEGEVEKGGVDGGEEGEDDEEDDEELEHNRLTALALGAGVEKISWHKETVDTASSAGSS